MGPLGALTAIVFGSAVAIAFGLNAVWIILWVVREDSADIAGQLATLPFYCGLFLVLSGVAGAATYSLLKGRPWRWQAQGAMWCALLSTALLVWWRQ